MTYIPLDRGGVRQRRRRGTGTIGESGYLVHCKDGIDTREHVAVAEKALGKPLPAKAVVHHINENKLDNATTNLVICPDHAYHSLIHMRMRALAACGNADWRKCKRCHEYGDPETMGKDGRSAYHRACNVAHVRAMKSRVIAG